MNIPCPVSAWSCPYHACMSNDCQKVHVISSGVDWGQGKCKEAMNIKKPTKAEKIEAKTLYFYEITPKRYAVLYTRTNLFPLRTALKFIVLATPTEDNIFGTQIPKVGDVVCGVSPKDRYRIIKIKETL